MFKFMISMLLIVAMVGCAVFGVQVETEFSEIVTDESGVITETKYSAISRPGIFGKPGYYRRHTANQQIRFTHHRHMP